MTAQPLVESARCQADGAASSAVRVLCLLAASGGLVLAVAGLFRLALSLILTGSVLWISAVVAWELATGRFH